jgi:hypothetical protein
MNAHLGEQLLSGWASTLLGGVLLLLRAALRVNLPLRRGCSVPTAAAATFGSAVLEAPLFACSERTAVRVLLGCATSLTTFFCGVVGRGSLALADSPPPCTSTGHEKHAR